MPGIDKCASLLSKFTSELEKARGAAFNTPSNESKVVFYLHIQEVTGIRLTDPDTYIEIFFNGYSLEEKLVTPVLYESHNPQFCTLMKLDCAKGVLSYDDICSGEFTFKLFQVDPDCVDKDVVIDSFQLNKGELSALCLSQGSSKSGLVVHTMAKGCTLACRYGCYYGNCLPSVYETFNTRLVTEIYNIAFLDTLKHLDAPEKCISCKKSIDKSIATFEVDLNLSAHQELIKGFTNVSTWHKIMENALSFEKSLFGKILDRKEYNKIITAIETVSNAVLMKETDPKLITTSLQSCNSRLIITSQHPNKEIEELQLN